MDHKLTSINYFELELIFCHKILKLNSLHYGYWRPSDKINLNNLRKAQARYTKHLLNFIPRGVRNILDVGCGVGDNAIVLDKKGYSVTGVTPDKYQYEILKGMNNDNITLELTKFEDLKTNKRYDCILMSESSHYFDMDTGLKKSKDLLKKNGHLLVANIFRKKQSREFGETHVESEWVKCAEKYGFGIIRRKDITKNVLPTLVFGEKMYKEYLAPIGEIIDVYFKKSSPARAKIIEFIFSKDIRRLFSLQNYLYEHLNSSIFDKTARYLIFLLQMR